ncbi:hypothetical protein QBC38DRAFT_109470 [Podospora fimiseda]|uniref:Uncharacterized protein n=1 Tax=Podospora fimiseda TaxID=252190 RepID=A0AAN7BTU0_9PEZI|nr:hypothetical protein QBC38DRAFT_109470 [Podospora fimiseda]
MSEQRILNAFKAAALSVTVLYKTCAEEIKRSKTEGIQECIEDLLAFLDEEGSTLTTAKVRKWATDKLDRIHSPPLDSDDEQDNQPEQPEQPVSSPIAPMPTTVPTVPTMEEVELVVPSQDTFTFQSSHPYPQDAAARLANLDLSDAQAHAPRTTPRNNRRRDVRTNGSRSNRLGQGAGQKRKVNLAEIWNIGNLDEKDRDVFGGGGKRSRHA